MARVAGIHHVTAIAGDPQENVDFYAGVLGMRLVKRSVNQDDPGTYHLFYADAEGHPGSDLTFFPWAGGSRGRPGTGLVGEVALAVPLGTLPAWRDRLEGKGHEVRETTRFEEHALGLEDPHGLRLALVATEHASERAFTPWKKSTVPVDLQVRGLHAARVVAANAEPGIAFAQEALGMHQHAREAGKTRLAGTDLASGFLDIEAEPGGRPGNWGVGTVHHVAWRVADDAEQLAVREAVVKAGQEPTPVIDRFWFRSVYFREPGNVLYELATDGPGFGVDEPMDRLGESLVLPPWLEDRRAEIEERLAPIVLPHLGGPGA